MFSLRRLGLLDAGNKLTREGLLALARSADDQSVSTRMEAMPHEKPIWEMTVEEFAANPPSYEWFVWFGWAEGHHYCHDSREYAMKTGYPCCIRKAIRDGYISQQFVDNYIT